MAKALRKFASLAKKKGAKAAKKGAKATKKTAKKASKAGKKALKDLPDTIETAQGHYETAQELYQTAEDLGVVPDKVQKVADTVDTAYQAGQEVGVIPQQPVETGEPAGNEVAQTVDYGEGIGGVEAGNDYVAEGDIVEAGGDYVAEGDTTSKMSIGGKIMWGFINSINPLVIMNLILWPLTFGCSLLIFRFWTYADEIDTSKAWKNGALWSLLITWVVSLFINLIRMLFFV